MSIHSMTGFANAAGESGGRLLQLGRRLVTSADADRVPDWVQGW